MPRKKINIGIEELLHRQAKVVSVLKGMTLNEFFIAALQERLKKDLELIQRIIRTESSAAEKQGMLQQKAISRKQRTRS